MSCVILLICIFNFGFTSAFNTTSASHKRLPQFKWLEELHSYSGIPLLNIKFPDGQEDDVAELNWSNPDLRTGPDCAMIGSLKYEKNVFVRITKGCYPEISFEISFNSKRLAFTTFKVLDGKVKPVVDDLPGRVPVSYTAESKQIGSRTIKFPVNGFILRLKVFYDDSFKTKFEDSSVFIVKKIVEKANDIFHWPSLVAKIKLELVAFQDIPQTISADEFHLNQVAQTYATDASSIDVFVFFADGQDDFNQTDGVAFTNGLCSRETKHKSVIVEWTESLTVTAKTLAHEIGHLLGMQHDFLSVHGKNYNRFSYDGHECTSINGIMDYDIVRSVWSKCSVEDFLIYFDNVTKSSTDGKFCLKHAEVLWSDWETEGSCTVSCGGGVQQLKRTCQTPSEEQSCSGPFKMQIKCNTHQCVQEGHWSNWEDVGSCSRSCEGGIQMLRRTCIQDEGNHNCSGPSEGQYTCNNHQCPKALRLDGPFGDWSVKKSCPGDAFIVGFMTQNEENQGRGDDTAMNGIRFKCDDGFEFSFDGPFGSWEKSFHTCRDGFSAAKIKLEPNQGRGDDTAMNGIQLFCATTKLWEEGYTNQWGDWTISVHCPPKTKIVGASVKTEGIQGSRDDTAMNGLEIVCA